MNHHLVILKKRYLRLIVERAKTIECRLSRTRHAPFRKVAPGDVLWLKQSGGPVVAKATAGPVRFFELNTPSDLAELEQRYTRQICADKAFFVDHKEARYASIIKITSVIRLDPFPVDKKDRLAWVVLRKPPPAHPPRSDPKPQSRSLSQCPQKPATEIIQAPKRRTPKCPAPK